MMTQIKTHNCVMLSHLLTYMLHIWAYGGVVSMFDFHRSDRGSNPVVDKAGGATGAACRQLQSLQAGHTQMTIFFFNVSLRCWQMQYAHNKSLTLSLQEAL